MKIRSTAFAALLFAALSLTACTANNPLSPSSQTAIRGTEWSLIAVGGTAVGTTGRRPTLLLAENDRAGGFAGCNQFAGSYSLTAESLRFSAMAMTRMFCAETMDLEERYVAALDSTRRYRVTGAQLELLGDQGDVVAVLEKR